MFTSFTMKLWEKSSFQKLDTLLHCFALWSLCKLVKSAVKENASTAQSQKDYQKKYYHLNTRYKDAVVGLEKLKAERTLRHQQDKAMALFIRTLKKNPILLVSWDDTIWTVMVEKGIVHQNGNITFVFYNGMEIVVGAE